MRSGNVVSNMELLFPVGSRIVDMYPDDKLVMVE